MAIRFAVDDDKALEALTLVAKRWPGITPFFVSKVFLFCKINDCVRAALLAAIRILLHRLPGAVGFVILRSAYPSWPSWRSAWGWSRSRRGQFSLIRKPGSGAKRTVSPTINPLLSCRWAIAGV